jgi:hypothetical protein
MVAQWLRYCATNRKVAGSIPEGVIGIFHWNNPPDRIMALESTQPLTEMSTRSISCGVKVAGAYGWQPYHHPEPLSCNLGTLTSWNPLGHCRSVTGLLYPFSAVKVFYSPTDAQLKCLKNNFKIHIKIDIKTAQTCFGVITIIRERTIRSC